MIRKLKSYYRRWLEKYPTRHSGGLEVPRAVNLLIMSQYILITILLYFYLGLGSTLELSIRTVVYLVIVLIFSSYYRSIAIRAGRGIVIYNTSEFIVLSSIALFNNFIITILTITVYIFSHFLFGLRNSHQLLFNYANNIIAGLISFVVFNNYIFDLFSISDAHLIGGSFLLVILYYLLNNLQTLLVVSSMRGTGLKSSITDLYTIGEEFYIIVVSGTAISFTFLVPNLYPIFYILILLLFIQQIQKHSEIRKYHRSQLELEELKHEKELEYVKLQKLESLQLFASKVAHDIKNYLTILIGNLELLDPGKFDKQDPLKNIKQATFNIQDVIEQLFDYSTHDRLNKQEIEINQFVSEVTEFVLSDHGIAFNVDTYPVDIFASIDRIKIYTVVSNILINAIEAIKDYSQFDTEQDEKIRSDSKTHKIDVKVDVEEVGDTIFGCISIKDTGIGIRDENTEQVFEPFYTTKKGGTGLGIATAHAIVQAHNGNITLTSTYMKSTQFVIRLPIKSV